MNKSSILAALLSQAPQQPDSVEADVPYLASGFEPKSTACVMCEQLAIDLQRLAARMENLERQLARTSERILAGERQASADRDAFVGALRELVDQINGIRSAIG